MTTAFIAIPERLIHWDYLCFALAAIMIMIAAIVIGNIWFLDFLHVFSSLLWTGIDLFMGFVLGPILRRTSISVRREVAQRLTPRTLFLMTTVSIISGTTGWFLAVKLGYTALDWPAYGWIASADFAAGITGSARLLCQGDAPTPRGSTRPSPGG